MAVEAIAEGEVWAYRKAPNPPIEVTIVKVVSQSGNAKVRIQFDDGPKAGQIEWVSRRSLKAPWARVDKFLELERRWQEFRDAGSSASRSVLDATGCIIEEVVGSGVAWGKAWGILGVKDYDALSGAVPEILPVIGGQSCITEGDIHYFAWPTARDVAKGLARTHAERLLDFVEDEAPGWFDLDLASNGENGWARSMIAAFEIIRSWCGEAPTMQLEIRALRKNNARLADYLEKTLNVLERTGDPYFGYHAKRIRNAAFREFGPAPDWMNELK